MYAHPEDEFGIDRDPSLPTEVTNAEQKSGHVSGPLRKQAMEVGGVSVTIFGIPWDATIREATQIFRQYDGFIGCQMRGEFEGRGKVAYVQFSEEDQAEMFKETLSGYQFDERDPRTILRVIMSKKSGEGAVPEEIIKEEVYEEPEKEKKGGKKGAKGKTETSTAKGKSKGKGKSDRGGTDVFIKGQGGKGKGKAKGKNPY